MGAIITLTTDFGLEQEYVGVMKGVILSRAPAVRIVDLSHGIAPHDISSAGRCLKAAFPFFPAGTIHVAVVDPGVGTRRRVLLCQSQGHLFLVPDNGLFSVMFGAKDIEWVREVACDEYFLQPVSATFHGRDIFAPVAAALATGVSCEKIGPEVASDSLVRLHNPPVTIDVEKGVLRGCVCGNDHFGNLLTTIQKSDFDRVYSGFTGPVQVTLGGEAVCFLGRTYSDAEPGEFVALFGGSDSLEIAINQGSAARRLGERVGEVVEVFGAVR